jgi:hypothetical protein
MSELSTLVFPDLVLLEDYNGDFKSYFNAVYKIFEQHFIKSNPVFCGIKVTAQKFPLVDGIHKTFYHITHEGEIENDRQPDIRRMERIRFPKFCIESCPNHELLVWKNQRGRDTRILIFHEVEGYLLVLTERKEYNMFCTAYYVEQKHRRKKYLKEYESYIKAKTAQGY